MSKWTDEVNGKLGFGCMRLPEKDGSIDYEEMNRMVDAFIGAGFNYFDTAHSTPSVSSMTGTLAGTMRARLQSMVTDVPPTAPSAASVKMPAHRSCRSAIY